ncbi:MAG TPA: LuxR C-terminal-related transcriptional regulator [bacterium]|nr:LuxR C-terminal-related transcriptional regulator [bacterium]
MALEPAIDYALSAGLVAVEPRTAPGGLTVRELQVAALVAHGMSNRAIATELVVAERTAETHVQNILNKLGFSSRAQVAAWAMEQGLRQPKSHRP